MKVVISRGFLLVSGLLHMSRVCTGDRIMAAWRRAIELSLGDADTAKLRSIAQSRTEPASRVERARILLAYREDPSFFCGRPGARTASSDGLALRRTRRGPKARWLRSTIALAPAGNRRSRWRPRLGWWRWH